MRCFGCCFQNWHIDFFQYDFGQLRSNLWTSFFNVYFSFVFSMLRLEKFRKNDQLRSNLWGDQSSLSWTFPTLHSNTRGSMRNTSPTEWFGTIDAFHCMFFPANWFIAVAAVSLIFQLRICHRIPARQSREGVAALLMEAYQHLQQAAGCCTSLFLLTIYFHVYLFEATWMAFDMSSSILKMSFGDSYLSDQC